MGAFKSVEGVGSTFHSNDADIGKGYTSLLVGNLEIVIDKSCEELVPFDGSMCDSDVVPLSLHEESMTSSSELAELDDEYKGKIEPSCVITPNDGIEDDSVCGTSTTLVPNQQGCRDDDIEEDSCVTQVLQDQSDDSSCEVEVVHKADSPHNLENQLRVNEEKIVAVLTHYDRIHKLIEDHLWKAQLERRQQGIEEESSHASL